MKIFKIQISPIIVLQKAFPGLFFWLRLPGIISWTAVVTGILIFKKNVLIPSLLLVPSLYHSGIILATFSLILAVTTKNSILRYFGFLIFTIFLCSYREKTQKEISALFGGKTIQHAQVKAKVLTNPAPQNNGYKFLVKCQHCSFDQSGLLCNKTFQCVSSCTPCANSNVILYGSCSEPKRASIPYEFDEHTNLAANGIYVKMTIDSVIIPGRTYNQNLTWNILLRERVLRVLDHFKKPAHRSILRAAFLGEKEFLDTNIKDSFRKSGIYHLLAISGLHAGMLIAATYLFLTLIPIGNLYKHSTVLLVLWLYQIFVGFIPSLFRATIMSSFIIVSLIVQKKNYALQSLGIAGTCWLLLSPESLFLPGFQLSFAATLGITTLHTILNQFRPKSSNFPVIEFFLKIFFSIFNVSLAGFLSTAPILLYHFGTLSLYGLVANLCAVTMMTWCMWAFFVSLVVEPVSLLVNGLTTVSSLMLDGLIWISNSAEQFPWSQISVNVPSSVVLGLYVLFLLSVIMCNKKHIYKYVKWSTPSFLTLIAICYLLQSDKYTVKIEQFSSDVTIVTAIRWPHRGVWLFCDGTEQKFRTLFNRSIKNWLRFQQGIFLEKIIISDPEKQPSLQFMDPENLTTLKEQHRNPVTESSYRCELSKINGLTIRIFLKNRWIECNSIDSTVQMGIQCEKKTSRIPIPAVIHINAH